jgi:hypothetical protein
MINFNNKAKHSGTTCIHDANSICNDTKVNGVHSCKESCYHNDKFLTHADKKTYSHAGFHMRLDDMINNGHADPVGYYIAYFKGKVIGKYRVYKWYNTLFEVACVVSDKIYNSNLIQDKKDLNFVFDLLNVKTKTVHRYEALRKQYNPIFVNDYQIKGYPYKSIQAGNDNNKQKVNSYHCNKFLDVTRKTNDGECQQITNLTDKVCVDQLYMSKFYNLVLRESFPYRTTTPVMFWEGDFIKGIDRQDVSTYIMGNAQ